MLRPPKEQPGVLSVQLMLWCEPPHRRGWRGLPCRAAADP